MAGDDDLKEQLSQFQDAIRAKDNWVTKILDEKRGLMTKWAVEAGLLAKDQPASGLDDEKNVNEDEDIVASTLRYALFHLLVVSKPPTHRQRVKGRSKSNTRR